MEMTHMRKMMAALALAGLAAVLLGAGCRDRISQSGSATGYVSVTRPAPERVPARTYTSGVVPVANATMVSTSRAGDSKIYVELARPQSDDQGYYVPVRKDAHYRLMGYASGRGPVTQVMVNGYEAETYSTDYRPYGSPAGYRTVGFRVPLTLGPGTLMTITVIGSDGHRQTRLFHPNRKRAHARVRHLWGLSQRDPYANVRLANVYTIEGQYHNAYPLYHRSIGLSAGFVWGPFFMGVALFENGRYDDAIPQFHHCYSMDQHFYLARYQIGQCYERRGNYALAITEYSLVVSLAPTFVEAHWSLGESYVQRNDWGRASIAYSTCLRYNPRFAPAHRGLGEVYTHQKNWGKAKSSLVLALSIDPRDARARADLTYSKSHKSRSPKQYRMAMAPLKAPRGHDQRLAETTRAWQGRQSGGQQAKPSPGREGRPSGGHQALQTSGHQGRPSGGQQAKPAARQHQVKPAARQQRAKPAARQQQARPAARQQQAKPAARQQQARPAARQQQAKPAARQQQARPAARQQQAKPAARQQQARPAARQQQAKPAVRQQQAKPAAGGPGGQTDRPDRGHGH
jgi:hypothetical protein